MKLIDDRDDLVLEHCAVYQFANGGFAVILEEQSGWKFLVFDKRWETKLSETFPMSRERSIKFLMNEQGGVMAKMDVVDANAAAWILERDYNKIIDECNAGDITGAEKVNNRWRIPNKVIAFMYDQQNTIENQINKLNEMRHDRIYFKCSNCLQETTEKANCTVCGKELCESCAMYLLEDEDERYWCLDCYNEIGPLKGECSYCQEKNVCLYPIKEKMHNSDVIMAACEMCKESSMSWIAGTMLEEVGRTAIKVGWFIRKDIQGLKEVITEMKENVDKVQD